ncbi:sulfurtransferase [Alphaproteobacteria bacterium]|nr:sulfurtransferase [Alphaproteobacteria bacterium]
MTDINLFIEPDDLKLKINKNKNIKILDATFYLPDSGLNAEKEYNDKHITGAVFFDINKIADPQNSLPHMIPSKEIFSEMMKNLGLNNDDEIIIYDNSPILSSARAWFLLRYFNHNKIFILKGGIKNWLKHNGTITSDLTVISKGNFTTQNEKKDLVKSLSNMIELSNKNDQLILDARSYNRYLGTAKEPRPGLPSGHIPNSKSLPSSDLINKDGILKNEEELKVIFNNNEISQDDSIIATCGSGVSACVITLALFTLGKFDVPIYDGSWTEWASSGQNIAEGNN